MFAPTKEAVKYIPLHFIGILKLIDERCPVAFCYGRLQAAAWLFQRLGHMVEQFVVALLAAGIGAAREFFAHIHRKLVAVAIGHALRQVCQICKLAKKRESLHAPLHLIGETFFSLLRHVFQGEVAKPRLSLQARIGDALAKPVFEKVGVAGGVVCFVGIGGQHILLFGRAARKLFNTGQDAFAFPRPKRANIGHRLCPSVGTKRFHCRNDFQCAVKSYLAGKPHERIPGESTAIVQGHITVFGDIVVKIGDVVVDQFLDKCIVVAGDFQTNFNAAFKCMLAKHPLAKTMNGVDAG